VAFVVSAIARAHSQVESGTVVIIGYSKQKVVVAADSRESNDQGAYRDEACKIAALNTEFIFTAAGRAKSIRQETILWDANREARTALADTERSAGEKPGDFQDRIAAKWGRLLAKTIGENLQADDARSLTDDEILVNGLLIGIDEVKRIHISHEILRARIIDAVPEIVIDPVKVVNVSDAITFSGLSEGDVFVEFQAGNSDRSKKWRSQIPAYAKQHGLKDQDMAKAMLLVDLTGTYGKERVPKNPAVHLVGGKIDAVELTISRGIQWIQRKSQCPEN
jgi:hypothetical protein